jgi:hypothetical protein
LERLFAASPLTLLLLSQALSSIEVHSVGS